MTVEVAPVARRKRPKRAKEQIVEIPVSLIDTGLNNRTMFDEDELAELARDIAERGLLQVPGVRPVGSRYQLVCENAVFGPACCWAGRCCRS